MKLAPIVLFTYNRPKHTQTVLNALALNIEAKSSDLYIYCDGPKPDANPDDVRKISQVVEISKNEQRFNRVIVTVHKKNKGLANSILDGVTEIINKYNKVIVLEDDIVVSKGFLSYMNDALIFYEKYKDVYHINGYNFKTKYQFLLDDYYFLRYMNCWGWATWKDRWGKLNRDYSFFYNKLLENKDLMVKYNYSNSLDFHNQLLFNINKRINTWAILWYSTIFFNKGYCLTSKKSYVNNIGLDGSGENCLKTNLNSEIETNINEFRGNVGIFEKKKSRLHLTLYASSRKPYGEIKLVLRTIKNIFVK